MTTEELDQHVTDWAEVLYGEVPQADLTAAYLSALRNPARKPEDQKFPLKVNEVLDAHRRSVSLHSNPKPAECHFCKQHNYDPTEYGPCPFHRNNL